MVAKHSTIKLVKFALKKHPLDPGGYARIFHSSCGVAKIDFNVHRQLVKTFHPVKIYNPIAYSLGVLAHYSADSSTKSSYDRNYITEERALNEFLLTIGDLTGLRVTVRRSANEHDSPHKVYWRRDVEARAVLRWGSLEKVQIEREVGIATFSVFDIILLR